MSVRRAAWALAGAWALASGCASDPTQGYAFDKPFDGQRRTIAVDLFENTTFYHGMEVHLTDAVVKEIQRSTPWTVVNGPGAETTLSGAITDVTLRKLATAPVSGLSQQVAVAVTIDFDWRDNRTGQALVQRRGQRAADAFVPAQGVGERIELSERAAVEEAARTIVGALRSKW
ncbi:MAG: hypothetical protein IBJ10_11535 [Phycisphaerales bacterium]|nr:hypothetical protein [Phycisphaerales bacterium]